LSFHKTLSKAGNPKIFFIIAIIALIAFNSFNLFKKIKKERAIRKAYHYFFYGTKFSGLKDVFKEVEFIGYYTDKDLDNNRNAAQFSQAQYELAPAILDLDYKKHTFILFDCSSEKVALDQINKIGAIPIKKNDFGIILAKRIL